MKFLISNGRSEILDYKTNIIDNYFSRISTRRIKTFHTYRIADDNIEKTVQRYFLLRAFLNP